MIGNMYLVFPQVNSNSMAEYLDKWLEDFSRQFTDLIVIIILMHNDTTLQLFRRQTLKRILDGLIVQDHQKDELFIVLRCPTKYTTSSQNL